MYTIEDAMKETKYTVNELQELTLFLMFKGFLLREIDAMI